MFAARWKCWRRAHASVFGARHRTALTTRWCVYCLPGCLVLCCVGGRRCGAKGGTVPLVDGGQHVKGFVYLDPLPLGIFFLRHSCFSRDRVSSCLRCALLLCTLRSPVGTSDLQGSQLLSGRILECCRRCPCRFCISLSETACSRSFVHCFVFSSCHAPCGICALFELHVVDVGFMLLLTLMLGSCRL